ncbi:putative armadillo-like helical, 26S proteasome non-ATPase regulatory subunit 5 [Helianthus annuus]|uniref:Armadillo-like helical, 26S proteasome non-ATPase regulatory subunit 5 n=2 Tax=Helianthus annuus TaxID=4232 RepID=A0A9K3H964_HELAN|nr:putative armadillo-like helical, 26S proteasome non-ATPase regulatory subunit 5 [Helianthus annuus]
MEYVLQTNILQLLISIIRNSSAESMLRSRATMISGRLLCKENLLTLIDESGVKAVFSAIDERISLLESQDTDEYEYECALEALGQIGSCNGRLLSKENLLTLIDESGVKAVILAIDERISLLESQDIDEYECALEALGQIGSCK